MVFTSWPRIIGQGSQVEVWHHPLPLCFSPSPLDSDTLWTTSQPVPLSSECPGVQLRVLCISFTYNTSLLTWLHPVTSSCFQRVILTLASNSWLDRRVKSQGGSPAPDSLSSLISGCSGNTGPGVVLCIVCLSPMCFLFTFLMASLVAQNF